MSNPHGHLSMWWDTLPSDLVGAERAPLTDDIEADVAIIGAGYTGLWTAYYLLEHAPTLKVVLLEAQVAGYGASGRNGGWCSALFPASWDKVARGSSKDEAVRLQRALFATVDEVVDVAAREGIDAQISKGGTLVAARTAIQRDRALEEVAHARSYGFDEHDYTWLDADAAAQRVSMTSLLGAMRTPHCAAVHPARLVRGLAQVTERKGAVIHERSPVIGIEPGRVSTERGSVRAPFIVRATEGYTATLPGFKRDLAPVYSLMVATEPLDDATWEQIGLRERETFADYRHLIIYGQRTADGRFAFGGRGAPYHFGSTIRPEFDRDPAVFAELERVLRDLFPVLSGTAFTHRWGGPLGVPRDWYSSVALDRTTGIAHAGGYVGDGVGTSNLGGRTLADLILDRDTELTTLPWVGHRSPRWEPEPFRWIGANTGLRVMATADGAEERSGKPSARAAFFGRFTGH
jgi:glycine/D-amino acid oxidase-like deaminating enzyme